MGKIFNKINTQFALFLPIKYPNFGKLFFGQFISNIGSQFSYMALQFLIFDIVIDSTGSIENATLAMALLAIAQVIPMILIGPWAGVIIDRVDRKYSMSVANFLQAIAIGLIPLTQFTPGLSRIYLIFLLAFFNSAFARFFFPARGASIPKLIDNKKDLFSANALSAATYQITALIGPLLAGVTLGAFGYDIPFFIDSLSFIISSFFILWINKSLKAQRKSNNSPLQDLVEGGSFVIHFRPMAYLLGIFSVLMLAGGASMILIIPFLEAEMGLVEKGRRELVFGLMTAASAGVGMVFAFLLSRKKRIGKPIRLITFSSIVAGIILLGFSVAQDFYILTLAWVGFGTIEVSVMIPMQTLAQETVPDKLRGKIFSFINLSVTISQIFGMGLVSLMASSFIGIRGSFFVNGSILILSSLLGHLLVKKLKIEEIAEYKRQEYYASAEG
ncbi:MAG: MFS transporter [Candidatus Hodarchaeales archaeon]